jgi:hypothetical protein
MSLAPVRLPAPTVELPEIPVRVPVSSAHLMVGDWVWCVETRTFGQVATHHIDGQAVWLRWADRPDGPEVRVSAGLIWLVADPVAGRNWNEDVALGAIDTDDVVDPMGGD